MSQRHDVGKNPTFAMQAVVSRFVLAPDAANGSLRVPKPRAPMWRSLRGLPATRVAA